MEVFPRCKCSIESFVRASKLLLSFCQIWKTEHLKIFCNKFYSKIFFVFPLRIYPNKFICQVNKKGFANEMFVK